MIEDMTIRKLAPKTQQGYIRTIKNFALFLGRSPEAASFTAPAQSHRGLPEDLSPRRCCRRRVRPRSRRPTTKNFAQPHEPWANHP